MVLIFQIYSSRELEETLNKIREILSDDKHDWDQRTNAVNFLSDFKCGWLYFLIYGWLHILKMLFFAITLTILKGSFILHFKTMSFHVSNHFGISFKQVFFKGLKYSFVDIWVEAFLKALVIVGFFSISLKLHTLQVNC